MLDGFHRVLEGNEGVVRIVLSYHLAHLVHLPFHVADDSLLVADLLFECTDLSLHRLDGLIFCLGDDSDDSRDVGRLRQLSPRSHCRLKMQPLAVCSFEIMSSVTFPLCLRTRVIVSSLTPMRNASSFCVLMPCVRLISSNAAAKIRFRSFIIRKCLLNNSNYPHQTARIRI